MKSLTERTTEKNTHQHGARVPHPAKKACWHTGVWLWNSEGKVKDHEFIVSLDYLARSC